MAPRKAHVKRIWKSDDDGNPIEDVWHDVLRIDRLPVSFEGHDTGANGQVVNFRFHWNDDAVNPDGGQFDQQNKQQEDANPSRKSRILYVKNPDAPDDDAQTNTLWIVDKALITMPQGSPLGLSGQKVKFAFGNANAYSVKNAAPPYDENTKKASRKTTVIKVVNNDLKGFDMRADDDGSGVTKSKLVPWDDYKQSLIDGAKDDSAHLDFEVTDKFKINFGVDYRGAKGLGINYRLGKNEELEPNKPGSLDPALFDAGDPDAKDANDDSSVVRTDPLQIIVNVSTPPKNFVVYGNKVKLDTPPVPFIMYSKNGKDWALADSTPPRTGAMVYGAGVWLSISQVKFNVTEVYRSKDLFKTWTKIATLGDPFGLPGAFGAVCYGRPKDATDPDVKKHGLFVFSTGGSDSLVIGSSADLGETWKVNFTISTQDDYKWRIQFVTCIKGVFYACLAGGPVDDPDGDLTGSSKPWKCVLYKSTDGTSWGNSTTIFSDITEKKVDFPKKSYSVGIFVNGMVLIPKNKDQQEDRFLMSGICGVVGITQVFYGRSADPAGMTAEETFGDLTPIVGQVDPDFPDAGPISFGQNTPGYLGGSPAATPGGKTIISLQKDEYSAQSIAWTKTVFQYVPFKHPQVFDELTQYLNVEGDDEGVLSPDFTESYFTGGTKDTFKVYLPASLFPPQYVGFHSPLILIQETKISPDPVEAHGPSAEAGLGFVAANGFRDDKDSVGTFVWTRTMIHYLDPTNPDGITNNGFEIWRSKDGNSFTKIAHPLSGAEAVHTMTTGAVPNIKVK